MNGDRVHTIKVFGPGCRNCERLTAVTEQALGELGRPEQVEKVTDPAEMAAHGIYSTPALMVDDELVVSGRIPGREPLKTILGDRLG
jgi:small redox-active disulfide protein 2